MTLPALLLAAITASAPHLSHHTRASYAVLINQAAHRAHVDPVLIVAIIENESRWQIHALGGSAGDPSLGLGQVRLRNYRACAGELDAPACTAVKNRLYTAAGNIAAIGGLLEANRKHCGKRVARYLAGYQTGGCKPKAVTWRVLKRYRALRRGKARRRR